MKAPEVARRAGEEALAASAHLDRSAAYDVLCKAVRAHTRVVPELIEAVSGERRIFWPGDTPRPDRPPAPSLF